MGLEEEYLDWFFMHYYHKDIGYWRDLTDEKINVLIALTQGKEKEFWDNWVQIFKKMFSK